MQRRMITKSFVLFYSFKKEIKMILFRFPIYIHVLAVNDWAVHVIPKSMNKQKCKKMVHFDNLQNSIQDMGDVLSAEQM